MDPLGGAVSRDPRPPAAFCAKRMLHALIICATSGLPILTFLPLTHNWFQNNYMELNMNK